MKQYLALLRHIRDHGTRKEDRTGTGTLSVFGYQMRFDLLEGFPVVTTKKLHLRSIIHELLWFLQGSTNIKYLHDNGVSIWDEWADENGELGPVYGYQWRSWPTPDGGHIDQISQVVDQIRNNPDSRRLIVSAWNVADVERMTLPACHALFQFYSREASGAERVAWAHRAGTLHAARNSIALDLATGSEEDLHTHADVSGAPTRILSCQLYQRSCDTFLGVPFNIASYALLTMMIAQVTSHIPGEFVWTGGDVHLYSNHLEQTDLQLDREPYPLPTMKLNQDVKDIFDFRFEDFELVGYECHPHIKAPVAV